MNDPIAEAVERAATEGGAPARVHTVPETADVRFSATAQGHPFDGLTLTHWSHDS